MNASPNLRVRGPGIAALLSQPLPTWRRAAVIGTTSEGTILYWNAAAERLYGWRAKEALGRNFLDVIPPASNRARSAELIAYLQAGAPFAGARTPHRKNGLPAPVYVLAIPVGDLPHGQGLIVTVSVPVAQRRLIWRDALRVQAEIERRLGAPPARYAARRPGRQPSRGDAANPVDAANSPPRGGRFAPVGSTIQLAALHRRDAVSRQRWRLMQRVETYRLRAERLVSPDRRPGPGEITLARMWLRLAELVARRHR